MRNSGGSPTSKQPRRRHSRSMRGKRGGDSLPSPTPRCVVAATGCSRSCRFRFCLPSRKGNTLGRTALPSLSSSCWALGRRLAPGGETRGPHPGGRRAWKRGPSSFLLSSFLGPAMSRGRGLVVVAVLPRNLSRAARTSSRFFQRERRRRQRRRRRRSVAIAIATQFDTRVNFTSPRAENVADGIPAKR